MPNAINDVMEVGQIYQTSKSRGLKWACVTAAGIAEATKPTATVDSIIGTIYDNCNKDIAVKEIDRVLKRTEGCNDFSELRAAFDSVYSGCGVPYCMSYANEVVTKAICILRTIREHSDGLHQAFIAKLQKIRTFVETMTFKYPVDGEEERS